MIITITTRNIAAYRSGTFTSVTGIYWRASPNDLTILRNFPSLIILSLDCTQITDLRDLPYCPSLQILSCSKQGMKSLDGIDKLPNLRILNCSCNVITDIEPLKSTNLIGLH